MDWTTLEISWIFLHAKTPNSLSQRKMSAKLSCKDTDTQRGFLFLFLFLFIFNVSNIHEHTYFLEKSELKWPLAIYLDESLYQNIAIPWSTISDLNKDRKGTLPFKPVFFLEYFICSFLWFLHDVSLTNTCVLHIIHFATPEYNSSWENYNVHFHSTWNLAGSSYLYLLSFSFQNSTQ